MRKEQTTVLVSLFWGPMSLRISTQRRLCLLSLGSASLDLLVDLKGGEKLTARMIWWRVHCLPVVPRAGTWAPRNIQQKTKVGFRIYFLPSSFFFLVFVCMHVCVVYMWLCVVNVCVEYTDPVCFWRTEKDIQHPTLLLSSLSLCYKVSH